MADQVPLLLLAVTALPPPNWLKSTVTLPIVSLLLLPSAVLFHSAPIISPAEGVMPLTAPTPLILPRMFASVTVGAMLSPVALVLSAVVVEPPALVAVTETLRLVASIEPPIM